MLPFFKIFNVCFFFKRDTLLKSINIKEYELKIHIIFHRLVVQYEKVLEIRQVMIFQPLVPLTVTQLIEVTFFF